MLLWKYKIEESKDTFFLCFFSIFFTFFLDFNFPTTSPTTTPTNFISLYNFCFAHSWSWSLCYCKHLFDWLILFASSMWSDRTHAWRIICSKNSYSRVSFINNAFCLFLKKKVRVLLLSFILLIVFLLTLILFNILLIFFSVLVFVVRRLSLLRFESVKY